ncbi:hypothetical protein BZA77DRAFT_258088 [Pyronema omphalodes]|nr:hypothetical protein BZA77DRAFT_258088 [Pyronema omphalodes]
MTTAEASSLSIPPNSPPTKASLTNWWERFKKRNGKDNGLDRGTVFHSLFGGFTYPPGIFGVPLHRSINYANVAISLTNPDNGESFVYGYVPIVVAKCGVFLKEKATDIEGIFRLSGSAKRIKDLQTIFDSPEKYGKGLDWTGYTVHDAANVLRRYLNQLPEPIIPLDFYNKFRDPLTVQPEKFSVNEAIAVYQRLISELPPLNRQLLLYILDLLAVFASKSEANRMTAENLAAIFQPGLISHPSHEMAPQAYKLSQDVLVFLINHQDHFLMGMRGTNDGLGGPELGLHHDADPTTPTSLRYSQTVLGRSPSNSSAAADDVRKFGGVRRNASVSSRKSGGTPVVASKSGSLSRSNTLPTKRSPRPRGGFPSPRPSPSSGHHGPEAHPPSPIEDTEAVEVHGSHGPRKTPSLPRPTGLGLAPPEPRSRNVSGSNLSHHSSPVTTPTKDLIYNFFSGSDQGNQRKLRKKRIPGSTNHSAESSTTSLPVNNGAGSGGHLDTLESVPQSPPQSPPNRIPRSSGISAPVNIPNNNHHNHHHHTSALMPTMSPTPSATSSVTSQDSNPSNPSYSDASPEKKTKTRSRWRWSHSKVEGWNPGSPPFAASTSSIAERMRRGSPSPPESQGRDGMGGSREGLAGRDSGMSDGSGDEEKQRGKRGWLRRFVQERDTDIPPAQLPPARYSQASLGGSSLHPPTSAGEMSEQRSAEALQLAPAAAQQAVKAADVPIFAPISRAVGLGEVAAQPQRASAAASPGGSSLATIEGSPASDTTPRQTEVSTPTACAPPVTIEVRESVPIQKEMEIPKTPMGSPYIAYHPPKPVELEDVSSGAVNSANLAPGPASAPVRPTSSGAPRAE